MEQLIISLVTGAVGGNVAGKLLKNLDLGLLGNSIAGIAGGAIGQQVLAQLGGGGMDSIISSIAGGGVGGGVVMVIVGIIRKAMAK